MKNKIEFDMIDRMYKSGKITAEDRDKLIAALDAVEETHEEKAAQEAKDMKGLESLAAGLKKFGEELKELNGLNELEGLKELSKLKDAKVWDELKELNGLNEMAGLSELKDILGKAGEAVKKSFNSSKDDDPDIKVVVDLTDDEDEEDDEDEDEDDEEDEDEEDEDEYEEDECVTVKGKNIVVKKINRKYDVPYDKLQIAVKYVNNGTVLKMSDDTTDADKVLSQCEEIMDKKSYHHIKELIKTEFTGVYKYIHGSIVLNVSVSPDEED